MGMGSHFLLKLYKIICIPCAVGPRLSLTDTIFHIEVKIACIIICN